MLFRRQNPAPAMIRRILTLSEMPAAIYAIGDIHGCLELYDDLEAQIAEDGRAISGAKLIVCLGDVIDRGPNSAGVLERLLGPAPAMFERVVLRGNHEDMMVEFLTTPERHLDWIDYGGDQTLASYGLRPNSDRGFRAESKSLRRKLVLGIPEAHQDFLMGLPIALEVGDLRFAHAGYDLSKPASKQSPELLMWGPFYQDRKYDSDATLVHGHVVVDEVATSKNKINLDLGAYQSGRLAAMRFVAETDERKLFVAQVARGNRSTTNSKED
ncbi:serine/threonine protein phosphatase 1 [Yoonia maritima]|uniref:Serine/threonine protein phosphatase 1 n=1 Tax=Yoonia maritima TaxID=1435347 RepID=A0A2T0VZV4_9RHOB|nr:metallophosphoesterase [Yoonia maritima]PRY78060.1 serine/threonine protein phosphatase 1 [Yoonia maritima]